MTSDAHLQDTQVTPNGRSRRATTLGIAMVIVGALATLPMTAFGALMALLPLAEGSLVGALTVFGASAFSGLGFGAIFFAVGAVAEFVGHRRLRATDARASLWNWCFIVCSAGTVVGLISVASAVQGILLMQSQPVLGL